LELFGLLWYASSRNTILFDSNIYLSMCEHHVIEHIMKNLILFNE